LAPTDHALVEAIARGSTDALADLYDRHAAIVFGVARRIVSRAEDAEEVVQDVFAQIWKQAARYSDGRGTVAGWMVMLARTRAIDRLRARRARPDEDRGEAEGAAMSLKSAGADPEMVALSGEQVQRVAGALATLPESQRSLLDLAYFEGLSQSEIAARTGTPLGTVKTRMRSAMGILRQKLEGTA
jgi:RNA polymerase sigma-70 factor (ECF subfamily)